MFILNPSPQKYSKQLFLRNFNWYITVKKSGLEKQIFVKDLHTPNFYIVLHFNEVLTH